MAGSEDIIGSLLRYGLTNYEARVFDAVVTQGRSAATELSLASGVPRSRIYDILSSLARKGWVSISDTAPIVYTAKSMDEIQHKLDVFEKGFRHARGKVMEQLRANLTDEQKPDALSAIGLTIDTRETLGELYPVIGAATDRIWLNNPDDILIDAIFDVLLAARKRGVRVRLLSAKGKLTDENVRRLRSEFELKTHGSYDEHCNILVDRGFYANIFFRGDGIQASKVSYRKCINCLSAWMGREWDNV